jgi:hexulose-6-phosphate isomerase
MQQEEGVTGSSDRLRVAAARIGIMQGRLSPRPAGKLQAFPWNSYSAEFEIAARLGFASIEWIFEAERFEQNPIWTEQGRSQICELTARTGVLVRSVCADYFMERRLAGEPDAALAENRDVLAELIVAARGVGAERILIPLLESSAPSSSELKREVVASLRSVAPIAERQGITLGLELEIPGRDYAALIRNVASPNVRAYYDTGNSTAQGLDIAVDVEPLLPLLHAVHVKDRLVGGGSTPLGRGAANFGGFFKALARAGFSGDFVLQHYFEREPEQQAAQALEFVKNQLERARREAA